MSTSHEMNKKTISNFNEKLDNYISYQKYKTKFVKYFGQRPKNLKKYYKNFEDLFDNSSDESSSDEKFIG